MLRRLIAALLLFVPASAYAQSYDHAVWDSLLKRHVVAVRSGATTQVNYDGMARDRPALKAYLAATSKVSRPAFDRWSKPDQLAFLINVYNAATVELVLTGYPKIASIRDLGGFITTPWKKAFVPLLGKTQSLDDIEHGLIRGSDRYNDPRIHFAVNCASIGCPALARAAFRGATLDAQLETVTRSFLADRTRNRTEGNALMLSSIFKWYRGDFEKGWRGATTLPQFVARYGDSLGLTPPMRAQLIGGRMTIGFLDYDWRLNKTG